MTEGNREREKKGIPNIKNKSGYITVKSWQLTPVILTTKEAGGLKPAWAKSSEEPTSKKPTT
jgi:hypothetical protein